jgi:hypothetical protein
VQFFLIVNATTAGRVVQIRSSRTLEAVPRD